MKSYRNLQLNFGRLEHLLICTSCHAESQMLRLDPFKQAAGLGYFHLPTMGNTSQNSAVRILTWLLLFSVNVCSQSGPPSFCFRCNCCSVQAPNIVQTLFYQSQLYCILTSHPRTSAHSSFIVFNYVYMYICVGVCVPLCGVFVSAHRS